MSQNESLLAKIRKKFHSEKNESTVSVPGFDPARHKPVIRASICTGEQTGGFKDPVSGKFTEVMLISSSDDLREFQKLMHTEDIPVEY